VKEKDIPKVLFFCDKIFWSG